MSTKGDEELDEILLEDLMIDDYHVEKIIGRLNTLINKRCTEARISELRKFEESKVYDPPKYISYRIAALKGEIQGEQTKV